MSSVLDRSELEQSPLADLHLLANELGVDGFRRLRRDDLIDAILARQSGDDSGATDIAEAEAETETETETETEAEAEAEAEEERKPRRGRRGGRGRGRARSADEEGATDEDAGEDESDSGKIVEGVVEL